MLLMIIIVLSLLGLCLGSFVNALVWRLRQQELEHAKKKPRKKYLEELSITKGFSMCPDCKHRLVTKDLIPVLSWLSVGGKCRYCRKPISPQYPIVELATVGVFLLSYFYWPFHLRGAQVLIFGLWLLLLTGLMALLVYDLHWFLLPNRIVYPLSVVAGAIALVTVVTATHPATALVNELLAVAVGGGIFYVLFQVSAGKWIGGGDVKLGWLLGLVLATPARAVLFIFLASLIGTVISLPLLASKRLKGSSVIPFGPFLIVAAIIVQLFGHTMLYWYQKNFLGFTL